jgi:two-component system sensor histidine kinase UhpB
VRLWRESHPEIAISTEISSELEPSGETAELTIYRIVQEALTNVFRHAEASSVKVTIAPGGQRGGRTYTMVQVRDDGRGLGQDHKRGFGLVGMRERLLALGGTFSIASAGAGVTVEALVPADAG